MKVSKGERFSPTPDGPLRELHLQAFGRLQDLGTRYANERDASQQEKLALELAQEATEERVDSFAMIYAIARLARQDNPQSVTGLVEISNYIKNNGLVFKNLVPMFEPERHFGLMEKALKQAVQSLPKYADKFGLDEETTQNLNKILDLTKMYWNSYEGELRLATAILPYPYTLDNRVVNGWVRSNLTAAYNQVSASTVLDIKDRTDPQEVYESYFARTVSAIDMLKKVSRYCQETRTEQTFDLYRKKFGGISFQDTYERIVDTDEVSQAVFQARQINRFLAALPKGDCVWDRITDAIFLYPLTYLAAHDPPEEILSISEYRWFQKLSVWRQQLADQVLAQSLAQQFNFELPEWFVQEDIESILKQLLNSNDLQTGLVLTAAIGRGVTMRSNINLQPSLIRYSKQSILYQLSQQVTGLMDEDEMVHHTLSMTGSLPPQLTQKLYELGDREGLAGMALEQSFNTDKQVQITSETFVDWAHEHFGENLIQKLGESEAEVLRAISLMVSGNYNLPFSRWGEEIVNVEVGMNKNSLARKLGIRASIWEFASDQNADINFVLLTNNQDLAVSGFVNLSTNKIELRFLNLPDGLKQLETSTKLVAAATLHDILGRNVARWHKPQEKGRALGENSTPHKDAKKKLPRSWFRVDSEELINDFDKSRHRHRVEGETRKPAAYVSAHIRRVPYGAVIEAMIEKHQDPDTDNTEREKLLKEIRDLRDGTDPKGRKLGRPDVEKVANLPPVFHREVAPIIDPDGKLLYTRTFVAPHFNPKLKPGDYDTFVALYEASYTSHGSSLAFLDLALAELSGIERASDEIE